MTDLERHLMNALKRLEQNYSEREQRLEGLLSGLGGQVQALAQQVEDLSSQLAEFQKVLPKD